MVINVTPALGVTLRPCTDRDRRAVLELINADRLPGQPLATEAMPAEALAGRSPIDSGWWTELRPPSTAVAVDRSVVGVLSYAIRPQDDTGLILWLHCRERPTVARALTTHALTEPGPCRSTQAFQFAPALTPGLEGLPVRHRPATHSALTQAGFTSHDAWRYMRIPPPAPGLPRTPPSRPRTAGGSPLNRRAGRWRKRP